MSFGFSPIVPGTKKLLHCISFSTRWKMLSNSHYRLGLIASFLWTMVDMFHVFFKLTIVLAIILGRNMSEFHEVIFLYSRKPHQSYFWRIGLFIFRFPLAKCFCVIILCSNLNIYIQSYFIRLCFSGNSIQPSQCFTQWFLNGLICKLRSTIWVVCFYYTAW